MSLNFIPFVEKYRPTNFEDIVLNNYNRQIIQNIIKTKYFPNLLLSGGAGGGKTTTIINLIKKYQLEVEGKENNDLIIHLNASFDRSIDIIRNQLYQFVNSNNLFNIGMKFVILDEADYLTKNAQQALKFLIQNYYKSVRFCIICNYISKIDDSLIHEFLCLRFNKLPEQNIIKFLENIVSKEGLNLNKSQLLSIQKKYKYDLRSMINYIQSINVNNLNLYVIDDELFENIFNNIKTFSIKYPIIENIENLNELTTMIDKVSIKYNVDKKTIMKNFLNFLIRSKCQLITNDFLNKISFLLHGNENNHSHYVIFILLQILKIIQ